MALVKLGNHIISIRGGFGGVYFKNDKGIQHVVAKPRHVRPTGLGIRGARIASFSGMAAIWALALLGAAAILWAAFAAFYFFTTRNGERKKISGYNWFMHFANLYPEENIRPFWKPPHAPGVLPDYYAVYKGMWQYEHTPEEWPEESPGDYYWLIGLWNNKEYYRTDDYGWFLWWNGTKWVMSPGLGIVFPGITWYSFGTEIRDYYRNPDTNNISFVYQGKRD